MAKNLEFYKGRRKRRNYALIPFVIVLGLLALVVVLFYGMQKYAVISKDGIEVILPGMEKENIQLDSEGHEIKVFEPVEVSLEFRQPDYSRVEAVAGKRVRPIRAIYIPAQDINRENLLDKAARLSDGNALMLEMKPRAGYLMWNSSASLAVNYGLNAGTETANSMPQLIQDLRAYAEEQEKDIWLAAQISCCIDNLLPNRSLNYTLRTEYGAEYYDETGYWLDPYNADLRNYIVELVQELYDMGFDEVVLADVVHPVPASTDGQTPVAFQYTREMSTAPNPINAVCGMAVYVANQMKDRKGLLSIYTDTPQSLVRNDEGSGQNAVLFMKIYDRVYYRTDTYTYPYNLSDIENNVPFGDPHDRFVPVVINYIPRDNSSWIYIEVPETA